MKKQISVLFFCLHIFSLHGMEKNASPNGSGEKKNKILKLVITQTEAQNPKLPPKEAKKQKPQPVTDANQKKNVQSFIDKKESPKSTRIKLNLSREEKLNTSSDELNTSGSSTSK